MNNRTLAERERNREKERCNSEPYEIPNAGDEIEWLPDSKSKIGEIAKEVIKLLVGKELSYLEMNEVLYLADKVLRNEMLKTKLHI